MGRLVWIFLSITIITLIVTGVIFIVIKEPELSSEDLEECVTIKAGNNDGTNIVFFGDSLKRSEEYSDYFLEFSPYNNYKEDFNFYYINYIPECEIYKGVAILCYSRDLIKKAGSCPNDHIVVLENKQGRGIRSSNYLNVMSINTKHPLNVLAHEFGHSFVNLAEEYVPAKIPRNSAGNCVKKCDDFNSETDGCYQGCSEAGYFRSISDGVMRTLRSNNYGIFNKNIIIKKILSIRGQSSGFGITGKAIDNERKCEKEEYSFVDVKIKDGKFNIDKIDTITGCPADLKKSEGPHGVRVVTEDQVQNLGQANFLDVFTTRQLDNEEIINGPTLIAEEFYLQIPHGFFTGDVFSVGENKEVIESLKKEESDTEDIQQKPKSSEETQKESENIEENNKEIEKNQTTNNSKIFTNESFNETENNQSDFNESQINVTEFNSTSSNQSSNNLTMNKSMEIKAGKRKIEIVNTETGEVEASVPLCTEIIGDVNGDSEIDIKDKALIEFAQQLGEFNNLICLENLDLNNNGIIETEEILEVMKIIEGAIGQNTKKIETNNTENEFNNSETNMNSSINSSINETQNNTYINNTQINSSSANNSENNFSINNSINQSGNYTKENITTSNVNSYFNRLTGWITGFFVKE